jgi:hypothetical protein
VCNNTSAIALAGSADAVKVPHSMAFDPQVVKQQLGISVSAWDAFMCRKKQLSERRVTSKEAIGYFVRVFTSSRGTEARHIHRRSLAQAMALFDADKPGSATGVGKRHGLRLAQCRDRVCRSRSACKESGSSAGLGVVRYRARLKQKALYQALLLVT